MVSEKVVYAKAGIPTVAETPLVYWRPCVTDHEQVDEVEVDFLNENEPSFGKALQ